MLTEPATPLFAGRRDPEPALRPDRALCALCGAARRGQHQAVPHRQGKHGFDCVHQVPICVHAGGVWHAQLSVACFPVLSLHQLIHGSVPLHSPFMQVYRRDQPQMSRGRFREFFQCDFGERSFITCFGFWERVNEAACCEQQSRAALPRRTKSERDIHFQLLQTLRAATQPWCPMLKC